MSDAEQYQKEFDLMMQELAAEVTRKEQMDRKRAEKFFNTFADRHKLSPERREAIRERCIDLARCWNEFDRNYNRRSEDNTQSTGSPTSCDHRSSTSVTLAMESNLTDHHFDGKRAMRGSAFAGTTTDNGSQQSCKYRRHQSAHHTSGERQFADLVPEEKYNANQAALVLFVFGAVLYYLRSSKHVICSQRLPGLFLFLPDVLEHDFRMGAFYSQGYLGNLDCDPACRTNHLVVTAGYESEGCRLFTKRAQFRSHASLFILSPSSSCRKVIENFFVRLRQCFFEISTSLSVSKDFTASRR